MDVIGVVSNKCIIIVFAKHHYHNDFQGCYSKQNMAVFKLLSLFFCSMSLHWDKHSGVMAFVHFSLRQSVQHVMIRSQCEMLPETDPSPPFFPFIVPGEKKEPSPHLIAALTKEVVNHIT